MATPACERGSGVQSGGGSAYNYDLVVVPLTPGWFLRVWHGLRWCGPPRAMDLGLPSTRFLLDCSTTGPFGLIRQSQGL
jgi:hypothetical protein